MAVSAELSVVRAMARSGSRSRWNLPTNSAARCCASAALPPLPKRRSFRPPASASATRSTARASASPFSSRNTSRARALASNTARTAVELVGIDTGVAVVLLDHLEARAGLPADEEGLRAGVEQHRDVGVAAVVEGTRSDAKRTLLQMARGVYLPFFGSHPPVNQIECAR